VSADYIVDIGVETILRAHGTLAIRYAQGADDAVALGRVAVVWCSFVRAR
jgi:hypothetical protein